MTAGISKKKLKAILIDLDGTMFDTAPEIAIAMNQTLQALNFSTLSFDTIRQFIGKGVDNLVNQSLLASNEKGHIKKNEALKLFNEFYKKIAKQSKPYDDVESTLKFLQEKQIKLACVTNKPSCHTYLILEESNFEKFFDCIICGDEMKFKKPHQFSIDYVRKKLDVAEMETLMVGDSSNDIRAANNAGVSVATVPYGYQYEEPIENFPVSYALQQFSDLKYLVH
ncbi:HAD-IA family hydrolase [Methylophilaceae bacterium]|jgi:phosphoglycolate phosphatase|nr:HAD-IA family hydrolase [Methylophilaceae bacterium]